MSLSRRAVCCGAIAAAPAAYAAQTALPVLVEQSAAANAALMRGDIARYRTLLSLADDFLLMSPFGGKPSRGPKDAAGWSALGRFFANGSLTQEVVQTWEGTDMAVLAVIERAHVEVGGLPAQDWALRVTLVYRRTAQGWELAHRHADPLAHGISLQQAAALGRGASSRHQRNVRIPLVS
jgi:ketosteroid isomerase-like protein